MIISIRSRSYVLTISRSHVMFLQEAISFIRPGVHPDSGTWADIGAGTGLFTLALMQILTEGKVIALDKSPHALHSIKLLPEVTIEIREGDFNLPIELPPLDGILMANALHYANDHIYVLNNVLSALKDKGSFVLVEYDTETPNVPWVPNPVSLTRFRELCKLVGLTEPELINERTSIYQDGRMYAVVSKRIIRET